jgi:hypothetical protein
LGNLGGRGAEHTMRYSVFAPDKFKGFFTLTSGVTLACS